LAWLRDDRILLSALSGDALDLWLAKLSPGDWQVTEPFERLTFGAGQITSASAASNGTVAFTSAIAPTRLWSLPLSKEGQRSDGDLLAFPSNGGLDYFPSLNDTGKMAYLSRKSRRWDLWIRDLKSGRETWLASVEGTQPFAVSAVLKPDSSRVAYSDCRDRPGGPCAVFTVSAAGGPPEKICEACGQVRAWSIDGRVMASQERVGEEDNPSFGVRINRIDPLTRQKTVMAEKPGLALYAPDFSPDGRWVAFQGRGAPIGNSVEQLFVAPLDSDIPVEPSRWITITRLEYFDAGPHWSRDGRMLYFTSDRDGSTCLWAIRLDQTTKKPLGEPFPVRHFHANPRQYSSRVYPIFSVGPDRLVISLEQVQSDLWMMQLPER